MWKLYSFLVIISSTLVLGVDEETAKGKKCFVPKGLDLSIDYEWVLSNTRWYFPLMSSLEYYRTAWDLLQKPISEISEQELSSACIYSSWEGMSPTILGFNGQSLDYDITPMEDSVFVFGATWRDGDGGKMYLAKTDNKSYIIFLKCWDDSEMSWNVMSTSKTLPSDTKKEILTYIESLGFSKGIIEQNYDSCKINAKIEL